MKALLASLLAGTAVLALSAQGRAALAGIGPDQQLQLQAEDEQYARIDSPTAGQHISGHIEIRGRATTPDPAQFDYYRIYIGRGVQPTQLRPLGQLGTVPVEEGVLAVVDTSPAMPGVGSIMVRVYARDGATYEASVTVNVEASPPPMPTFTGPIIVVPTVEATEPPAEAPADIPAPQLAPVVPAPAPPPFQDAPPPARPEAPIPQIGPGVNATVTGDPVQGDPITHDIEVAPPVPTPVPFVPIPPTAQP